LMYPSALLTGATIHHMSYENIPDTISYDALLVELFKRPVAGLSDEDMLYFFELVKRLRELKELTDSQSWWLHYYR
jgi:hypothetical protein